MIALGNRPEPLSLVLHRDASFLASLVIEPGPWPNDVFIELEIRATQVDPSPVVWTATIDGGTARWEVTPAEVNAVLDEGLDYVRLIYRELDGTRLLWAEGPVTR